MKTALVLYPNQLFPLDLLPDADVVYMVEEPLYFGTDQEFPRRLHKQKLILHRASMRRYVEEVLWPAGKDVNYLDMDVFFQSGDILDRIQNVDKLYIIDPLDETLNRRLLQKRRESNDTVPVEFLANPGFYLKDQEVRKYFNEHHKHPFSEFYQWQRERFNVLIDEAYKPAGGKLMYEHTDKKVEPDTVLPSFQAFGDNDFVHDAIKYVEKHFPENPGSTDFVWPTNHQEARAWLDSFVEGRIEHFATYQNAIDGQAAWLYHSALAASMNIGLLHPSEVVDRVSKQVHDGLVDVTVAEPFVRNVLGWREFVRGRYLTEHAELRSSNPLNHQRKLTANWQNGTLGIPPFDDVVKKLLSHGYIGHNERLQLAGGLMVLCEIHPEQIFNWFASLSIDAYDWCLLTNVLGLFEFDAKEGALTRLSLVPSSYIMQMSNYQRGEWADVWDGLLLQFIEKHHAILAKNTRMRVIVQRFDRLDADRKRIIGYRANDFLNRATML